MISIETLVEYLHKRNVEIKDDYFKASRFNNDKDILQQISLISKMDKILTDYSSIGYTRLYSTIGKKVENYKVELRRLKADLEYRDKKKEINEMDLFIVNNGEEIIKQGYRAINFLKSIDYLKIIKRSMNNNEICLGRTDESNLRKEENIEIGKLKNTSYNLIEEDAYAYLKKLKRRNKNVKMDYYIDEFININKLSRDSKEYIKILLYVPSDTLKHWIRYKEGRKKNSPAEQLRAIKRSLEYEEF